MPKPSLERVEALFHQAAELAPAQRSTFLEVHCADDTQLRAAVELLLKYDTGSGLSDSLLVSPVRRIAEPSPDASRKPTFPTIPGYEMLEELGRGGMGVVFKARQTALNRVVALKMLLAGSAAADQLARFRIEAEALARLQHPHIVQIYDVGEQDGYPYFSMEYVAGPSLDRKLGGMPQPIKFTARVVEILASAIHAVHRCGIIHRDLKPANILLSPRTDFLEPPADVRSELPFDAFEPKISDFGLAKLMKDQPPGRNLTELGLAMGTPSYMAPEQAWGKVGAFGPRTDVYALGAVLYEMLTGRPPFEGETATETILQVLSQEPVSPALLRPKLPRDLVTICLKCLEKEPRKRYASAEALAEDLGRFRAGEPISARPVTAAERTYRWCRRRPTVAALLAVTVSLVLALLATVLVYNAHLHHALAVTRQQADAEREQVVQRDVAMGMRCLEDGDAFTGLLWFTDALRLDQGNLQQEERHRTRISMALQDCPRLVQLLILDEPVLCVQWSLARCGIIATDGDRVVRVWDLATGAAVGPGRAFDAPLLGAAISPDGQYLAASSRDSMARTWDRITGKPLSGPLPLGAPVHRLAFHGDGRVLLTRRDDFVVQFWDVMTGKPIPIDGLAKARPLYSTFSDDGRWAFILDAGHVGRVWNAATGEPVAGSIKSEQEVTHGALSLDGCRIALVGTDNQVRIWERRTGSLLCPPLKPPCAMTRVCFSPKADHILTTGEDRTLRIWQVATGEPLIRPLRHEGVITQARFSPDGRLVVSAGTDNQALVREISTGNTLTPPLEHNGSVADAIFSADSEQVLTIGKDGTARLWELPRTSGRGAGKVLPGEPASPENTASPVHRRLSKLENDKAVLVIDTATGVPLGPPLGHQSKIQHAVLSPDGSCVLTASDDNTAQLWNATTGERLIPPCRHKSTVRYAMFSPDGRRLITASDDRTARVWDSATGEPLTPPLKHPRAVVRAYFSPDGNQAITVGGDGIVLSWSVRPDERPVATLVLLAEVLAGKRVDENYGVLPLDGNELRTAWTKLRSGKSP
jgi:WD40 repeat protein